MPARVSRDALLGVLSNHVVEVTFVRRIPIAGRPAHRRGLLTNCTTLLNSALGVEVLNFFLPKGFTQPYSLKEHNLVLAWDIFWQDYRQFGAESASIVSTIPVSTPEDQQAWWEYFQQHIAPMTPGQRMAFMDK